MPLVDETAIRQWADRHECRAKLPVLLRRLIRNTASGLRALRLPGNEAVDLPGLDGQVEVDQATTWVPGGHSIWEMGCNRDPRAKAEGDYGKRVVEVSEDVRRSRSFVFVTPRRWPGKDAWLTERRARGEWGEVRAYDAVDLETWLEEDPVTSRWLGELLGIAQPGLLTPEEWWSRWSTASAPPISRRLVATRRYGESQVLLEKLRAGDRVVPVMGDDRGEAVAFVVANLCEAGAEDLLDRALVVTRGDVVLPPATGFRPIIITDLPEGADVDLGDRRALTLVRTYPKGRLDVREPLQLSHIPAEAFRAELEGMGFPSDEAERHAYETGHSVTVLRRRLSRDPEVRRPAWARNREAARRLLPFALAGSWLDQAERADAAVLALLGSWRDEEVQPARDFLLGQDEAPVARYGDVNVVVSQLDALFALGPVIERDDLNRFFDLVPELLGDRDPALDLPQDQWWMANVLGKARSCSGALLSGLGDTLCILAVHGAEICGRRLETDLAWRADRVARALMTGADEERWLSIRRQLRVLAEAAPVAFLDCLEAELRQSEPAIRAIMGTVKGSGLSGECLRTDLLWALELLAWHPEHFARVAGIVFDLRRFDADDNWSNTPASTAAALFRAWLPSTALDVEQRVEVLRRLSRTHRRATIDVCISLLPDGGPGFATRSARPRWRSLAQDVPDATNLDLHRSMVEASRLLLDMAPFETAELGALLGVATRLYPDDLSRLVIEVERWAGGAGDDDKAKLRHDLRQRETLRAYQEASKDTALAQALSRMGGALEPTGATARHRWLFDSRHVEWRALVEEEDKANLSWQEREARVQGRRASALAEVEAECGPNAVLAFALDVKHPELAAQALVPQGTPPERAAGWVGQVLGQQDSEQARTFLGQVLWTMGWSGDLERVMKVLEAQGALADEATRGRLARSLPGQATGWRTAANLGAQEEAAYWETVLVRVWQDTPAEEVQIAVTRLLEANRPRAAFEVAHLLADRLPASLWERVLDGIMRGGEPGGPIPHAYGLEQVFARLDGDPDLSEDALARLELPFAPALCHHGHRSGDRTLALHRVLAREPALFVQFLRWMYRRRDGAAEPDFADVPDSRRQALYDIAHHTLDAWNTIPGMTDDGTIDSAAFTAWNDEAAHLAAEANRLEVSEVHIGALYARLARRRPWDDWLPEPVLDLLDRPDRGGLRDRFDLGVRNARGVTVRGPYDGGAQEQKLAEQYRALASRYGNSHPRVAAMLTRLAESYEWDARRENDRAAVGERWHP